MVDDTQAIKNLIYAYCELLDVGDVDGLTQLFERCTVRLPGQPDPLVGAAAIQRLVTDTVRMYDGIPSTKHLVTNVILEVGDDGATADARSYYVAIQGTPLSSLQPIIAGRWHDHFERDGGRWWFMERVLYADLLGDISHHIKSH